ncbi:MAG TPA: hypothetical protein VGV67_05370 [Solirubrobacteraceae bacterium]|nr:hypothetical protein [Solirubrobacteraceae bacterium]
MTDERGPDRNELIAALLGPPGPELTCEECFEHLDRYVDTELAGGDADLAVPGMRAHLAGCPACGDDYESLLAFAGAHAGDPRPPA